MARRFLIEDFLEFQSVHFYTVKEDDEDKDESTTDEFIGRFSEPAHPLYVSGYKAAIDDILVWIEEIGHRGLHVCDLRFENSASALPPKFIHSRDLQFLTTASPPLRLYCIPLPPQIMILCGGGIKSGRTNKESPDLYPHFVLADKLGKKIVESLAKRELWTESTTLKGDLEIWI